MNASCPDETFTTVDLLTISCYTGEASLIKMGAAPTVVCRMNGEEPEISRYEQSSAPLGILSGVRTEEIEFSLNHTSRTVMTTDGIGPDCDEYINSLLENDKLTCEQISEKIMAYSCKADEESEEKFRRRDDKTVACIRLYRAG